jgi:hypothetical protein
VARAKRTHRADARRRSRHLDQPEDELGAASTTGAAPSTATPAAAPSRPGITAAFREAYHPANVREDIALLPWLLRTWAFLIPLGLIAAGSIAIFLDASNPISIFAFQTLVLPPAMAPIFVVGFFAKRASYLLGGILGVIDFLVYAAFLNIVLPASGADTPPEVIRDQTLAALAFGPAGGVLFASAAAWYRRFLNLSNANARRARQEQARAKAANAKAAARRR